MLYAILCYHDEDVVGSWSREQDAAVMEKLAVVQDKLVKQGRLGPVARLLPTTAATTLRKENPPVVIDGPYAETKEQDAAVMKKLSVVQDKLTKQGRLGPVARLLTTTAATKLRKDDPPVVLDGPFAETKEQLLGFYVVDCKNLDEALDVARDLGAANPGGAYEIRPVGLFTPGSVPA